MITRDQMFAPLLEACPAFLPTWDRFLASDDAAVKIDDPYADGPLYYIALGDLSRHLVDELVDGETAHFQAVFDVVETWIVQGDKYVSNAAVVGLLEGLQNVSGYAGIDAERFCQWLGPESRKAWTSLYESWGDMPGEQTPKPPN